MGQSGIWLPIAAYHQKPDVSRAVDIVRMGVIDYLPFPFDMSAIPTRITKMLAFAKPEGERRQRRAAALARISTLSPREKQVAEGVAEGLSNKEISRVLSISPRTVEIHRSNMIQKLRVRSTGEALHIIHAAGYLQ